MILTSAKGYHDMRFKNTIRLVIEDLHEGTIEHRAQGTFATYKQAEEYCAQLNEHYADKCIPKIASVTDALINNTK